MAAHERPRTIRCPGCASPRRADEPCLVCARGRDVLEVFAEHAHARYASWRWDPAGIAVADADALSDWRWEHAELDRFGPLWHAVLGRRVLSGRVRRQLRPPPSREELRSYMRAHSDEVPQREMDIYIALFVQRRGRRRIAKDLGITRVMLRVTLWRLYRRVRRAREV